MVCKCVYIYISVYVCRLCVSSHSCEEAQAEAAGNLNGFQGNRGGYKGEGDGEDVLGVHEELRRLLTVLQTSLRREETGGGEERNREERIEEKREEVTYIFYTREYTL